MRISKYAGGKLEVWKLRGLVATDAQMLRRLEAW